MYHGFLPMYTHQTLGKMYSRPFVLFSSCVLLLAGLSLKPVFSINLTGDQMVRVQVMAAVFLEEMVVAAKKLGADNNYPLTTYFMFNQDKQCCSNQ